MRQTPEATNDDLESLARLRFRDLSEAELRLLRSAPLGKVARCGPSENDQHPTNNPAKSDDWGSERELRVDLIRWLCVNAKAIVKIDPRGLCIQAGKLIGKLDLSFVSVNFPLIFQQCRFTEDAILKIRHNSGIKFFWQPNEVSTR